MLLADSGLAERVGLVEIELEDHLSNAELRRDRGLAEGVSLQPIKARFAMRMQQILASGRTQARASVRALFLPDVGSLAQASHVPIALLTVSALPFRAPTAESCIGLQVSSTAGIDEATLWVGSDDYL